MYGGAVTQCLNHKVRRLIAFLTTLPPPDRQARLLRFYVCGHKRGVSQRQKTAPSPTFGAPVLCRKDNGEGIFRAAV